MSVGEMSSEIRRKVQHPAIIFAAAVGVAAAVRLYLLWQYYCISSDGVGYIEAARKFYFGDVTAGLASYYPPGYPFIIALVYPLVGNWELSGQVISIACGVALLFPLYVLANDLYGENVALAACFHGHQSVSSEILDSCEDGEPVFSLNDAGVAFILPGDNAGQGESVFLWWPGRGFRLSRTPRSHRFSRHRATHPHAHVVG